MTSAQESRRAHAKLTVTLKLTGLRADGYHLIDAEMVSLDVHDVLVFDRTGHGLSAAGPFADGVPLDDTNLVARALSSMGVDAHVRINKRIPHGGGLGGGSSDAATAFAWAGLGNDPADLERASRIGADVAFCLVGGRARVRGIGEIVDPLPHVHRTFTLIIPPFGVSTPLAYQAWDDLGGPTVDGPNDLEPAAMIVAPALRWWRDEIGRRCGVAPTLAGSGATWFVEGEHQDALGELVDEGATVVVARTVPSEIATNQAD